MQDDETICRLTKLSIKYNVGVSFGPDKQVYVTNCFGVRHETKDSMDAIDLIFEAAEAQDNARFC